jgi:hypothetical protein
MVTLVLFSFFFFFFNQSSSIKVSLVRLETEDATYDIQTDIFIKKKIFI